MHSPESLTRSEIVSSLLSSEPGTVLGMRVNGAEMTPGMAKGTPTQREDPQSIMVRKARVIIKPGGTMCYSEERQEVSS